MFQPQRKLTSGPHASLSTLRPRPASEQADTKVALEAGIAEANDQDGPVIAAVLRQLYEESLHYCVRADLLDAVISGEMTTQQAKDFVSYFEATMNSIKAKDREKDKASLETGGQKTTDRG